MSSSIFHTALCKIGRRDLCLSLGGVLIRKLTLFLIVLSLFSGFIFIIAAICIKYITVVICIKFSILACRCCMGLISKNTQAFFFLYFSFFLFSSTLLLFLFFNLHIILVSQGWNSLDTIIAAEGLALTLQSTGNLKEAQRLLER